MNQNQKQTGGYRPFSPTKNSPTSSARSQSAVKSTVKRSVGSRAGHPHPNGQLQNPAELHKIMSLFQ